MAKFRKKPVVIEAIQYTGANFPQIKQFAPNAEFYQLTNVVLLGTFEGLMEGKPGDWIIRGVKGEFYPCKSDIFEATYEPV
jgi:hypothetical protein